MNAARIRALSIVSFLVVAAVVLVLVTLNRDTQTHASYAKSCPAGTVVITTDPLPIEQDITLKIYNASGRPGLAEQVAEQFRHRNFQVEKVGSKDNKKTIKAVANIEYGPKTVGAAQVVRAYLLMTDPSTNANMHFNLKSTSTVVTVDLGKGFRQIGVPTEVHQAIAALGTPAAPKGTCAKNPST
jgi:hypothetical protein